MSLDVFNLLMVLLAALAGGAVATRLGYPAILGELAAGILLGPPLLGILGTDDALAVIGKLGVVLLMLYIGLHLDLGDLGKASRAGALAAVGGFFVPAALGFGLMIVVTGDALASLFVAVAMGVTSLATKSRILVDLGILNTRVAHVLMAGALFSDVAALIIFAAILGLAATGTIALGGIAAATVKAALFLGGAWIVGTRLLPVAGRMVMKRTSDPTMHFLFVVLVGLALAAAADAAGLHAILGAFIAGLYVREGVLPHRQLRQIEKRARNISVGLLAPVFFVTAGFKVSFDVFVEEPLLLIGVVVLATVGKIVGTALFYVPTGHGFREGVAVGAGMNGRGAVEIIVAEIALAAGIIDSTVFSILVFMAIFTTATVPVLLTWSIRWLRRHGELVADERDGIVIIGAGAVGRQLAGLLRPAQVTLVDTNAAHCRTAAAMGMDVEQGSGLDEQVLADAGAANARALLAVTGNDEVNVLAAKIAVERFSIPTAAVALSDGAPANIDEVLSEFGGHLMFGRRIDIESWESSIEAGAVSPLSYTIADPHDVIDRGHAVGDVQASLESLPMVVKSGDDIQPFTAAQELGADARVQGVGRTADRLARAVLD